MANHKLFIPFIKGMEGGYVNDPLDPGGETNKGITIGTWRGAGFNTDAKIPSVTAKLPNGRMVTYTNVTKSLYEMTDEQWEHVYKTFYWDKIKGDQINNQSIANMLVDWIWASGPVIIRNLQTMLRVNVDGIVGQRTIDAINKAPQEKFFNDLKAERMRFIDRVIERRPTSSIYEKGWKRRVNEIKFQP